MGLKTRVDDFPAGWAAEEELNQGSGEYLYTRHDVEAAPPVVADELAAAAAGVAAKIRQHRGDYVAVHAAQIS